MGSADEDTVFWLYICTSVLCIGLLLMFSTFTRKILRILRYTFLASPVVLRISSWATIIYLCSYQLSAINVYYSTFVIPPKTLITAVVTLLFFLHPSVRRLRVKTYLTLLRKALYYQHPITSYRIRVVVLHPGSGPIRCTLRTISTTEEYCALSYCCGDYTGGHHVVLSGVPMPVSDNLFCALNQLRETELVLWIDSLSINQTDVKERNAVIQNMHSIYSNAKRVICWLGEATSDSETAIDLISQMPRSGTPADVTDLLQHYADNRSTWTSIGEGLMRRPYWRRLWVYQEMILAKEAICMCGSKSFELPYLLELVWFVDEANLNIWRSLEHFKDGFKFAMAHVWHYRQIAAAGDAFDLKDMIYFFHSKETTDPRDRIYGLLGFGTAKYSIIPDYKLPPWTVFADATMKIISSTQLLDIICLGQGLFKSDGIPSWVPDFAAKHHVNYYKFPVGIVFGSEFNASGGRKADCYWSKDRSTMNAKGRVVDRIKGVASVNTLARLTLYHGDADPAGDARDIMAEGMKLITEATALTETLDASSLPGENKVLNSTYPHGSETYGLAFDRTIRCDLKSTLGSFRKSSDDTSQRLRETARDDILAVMNMDQHSEDNWMGMIGHVRDERVINLQYRILFDWWNGRRFMITDGKRIGLAPAGAQVGDVICILYGASVPVVLRPREDQSYQFIEPCYLHGVMDGEAMELGTAESTFRLY